jgi:predicted amidohydrolase
MQVLAQLADEEDILIHNIDMQQVEQRRENMPLAAQRRSDLYEFIDKQA